MSARVAVVTGASRDLGRSMALRLAERLVGVLGTCRSSQVEADALLAEIAGEYRTDRSLGRTTDLKRKR